MDRSKKRASAGAGGISAGIKRPRINPSVIGNKLKRAEVFAAWSMAKKKDRKARQNARKLEREQLGDAAPPKLQPHTLENTREADDTVVYPDDAEVLGDEADDEFALFYRSEKPTKIMITTGCHPSGKIYRMVAEFMAILPNCVFYKRRMYHCPYLPHVARRRELCHRDEEWRLVMPAVALRTCTCACVHVRGCMICCACRQLPTAQHLRLGNQAGVHAPYCAV